MKEWASVPVCAGLLEVKCKNFTTSDAEFWNHKDRCIYSVPLTINPIWDPFYISLSISKCMHPDNPINKEV